MSLLSVDDLGFVFVFFLPGYLALIIYQKLSLSDPLQKDLDKIGWCLFFSTLLYMPYVMYYNLNTFDDIKNSIYVFSNFLYIMFCGIVLGCISGILVYATFRKNIIMGGAWNHFFENIPYTGAWVSITTKGKKEYLGKISKVSRSRIKGNLILIEPVIMLRDNMGGVEYHQELGRSMLILESEIESVVYVDE